MGEYGTEEWGVQCWITCGGGCTLTCITDTGLIIMDAIGISTAVNVDFDS